MELFPAGLSMEATMTFRTPLISCPVWLVNALAARAFCTRAPVLQAHLNLLSRDFRLHDHQSGDTVTSRAHLAAAHTGQQPRIDCLRAVQTVSQVDVLVEGDNGPNFAGCNCEHLAGQNLGVQQRDCDPSLMHDVNKLKMIHVHLFWWCRNASIYQH